MRKFMLAGIVLGLFTATPAMAVGGGSYLGFSLGGASTETEVGVSQSNFNENDFAWKIFGGYHFLQFFAIETAYRDLGQPSKNQFEVNTTGFDVSGLAGLPLGPVFAYGRLGVMFWDSDVRNVASNAKVSSDDGTDFIGGIGLSIDIAKIQLRGEVEYLDVLDGALMYTVGAAWRF